MVVGAGVIGLACAWRIAQRGMEVVVLDRADPGAGASGVAAGMLAPVGELTFGERELLEMTLASAEAFPGFAEEVEDDAGRPTGYRQSGALHVALDRDEAAELRRRHNLQRSLGLAAEWLAPRACRDLEPGLSPSFTGGVHAPHEAEVDPQSLLSALLAALEKRGVEVRGGDGVSEGLFEGGRIEGVRTEGGHEVRASHVVLAAGAWSRAEWLPRSARPPVRPVKGQLVVLSSGDGPPLCDRIVASERVYVVPRDGGRLVIGATVEERGFDTAITAGGVYELLREAYRLLPDVVELELVETAAGLRPGSPDNLPLIGPGALEGLVIATGHYRNGILLAPLTADAVVAVLAGEQIERPAQAAHPARLDVTRPVGALR